MLINTKKFITIINYNKFISILIFILILIFISLFPTSLWSKESHSSFDTSTDYTDRTCKLEKIDLNEDSYTNKDWLVRFLELSTPMKLDTSNIFLYKQKLLTTQVFLDVSINLYYIPEDIDDEKELDHPQSFTKENLRPCSLSFNLKEKWTLIPVLRGAFGGGTPLLVYGLFDTHAFGSLWTLGAEIHTYGKANPGGVIWAKAPRWLNGRYSLSLEGWKKNTISDLYDLDKNNIGLLTSSWNGFHGVFLHPLGTFTNFNLQSGIDYFYKHHSPDDIDYSDSYIRSLESNESDETSDYFSSNNIDFYTSKVHTSQLNLKLIYDSVTIDSFYFKGLRMELTAGGGNRIWDNNTSFSSQLELFYYQLFSSDINIAYHIFSGYSESKNMDDFYKLGGFDSIRGYPDGFMYGNKALYFNLEFRKTLYIGKWFDLQGTLFTDMGSASITSKNFWNNKELSYGAGVKIIVPSIYKLIIRLDYAIGIDGSQGFSIGCSDFFNAYKVL